MWMIFALLSMLLYATEELVGKKIVRQTGASGSWMIYAMASLFTFASAIVMWALGMGESGQSPVRVLLDNPLILLTSVSTCLATLLVFIAFRYVGVSVEASISGISSIFLFLGFVCINLFTGELAAVKELLLPGRLIPILVIIALVFWLSGTDEATLDPAPKAKKKHAAMVTGILIVLVACIFDASDSLIFAYCISEKPIGEIDYYMAVNLPNLFYGISACIMASVTSGKAERPRRLTSKDLLLLVSVGVLDISSLLTYVLGSGYDAVKFAILYIAYPIVPLIGAKVFLKERYTAKQYICIIGIAIASIVFCIMDYV